MFICSPCHDEIEYQLSRLPRYIPHLFTSHKNFSFGMCEICGKPDQECAACHVEQLDEADAQ